MSKGIQSLNEKQSIQHTVGMKVCRQTTGFTLQKGLRIFLICYLVLIYPLYRILPIWVAWENNIFENTQAVVLFAGFLSALYFAYETRNTMGAKLWLAVSPFWFVLFGREINWGRVFFRRSG
jgi:hypothetical protein